MSAIKLPHDLEAWAEAEVAAGRAASVSAFVAEAMADSRALRALRASLEAAEAEGGAAPAPEVMARLKARFPAQ
jgi:Arc/MetJ-type ribon-helix-helix transcriptional regulator